MFVFRDDDDGKNTFKIISAVCFPVPFSLSGEISKNPGGLNRRDLIHFAAGKALALRCIILPRVLRRFPRKMFSLRHLLRRFESSREIYAIKNPQQKLLRVLIAWLRGKDSNQ